MIVKGGDKVRMWKMWMAEEEARKAKEAEEARKAKEAEEARKAKEAEEARLARLKKKNNRERCRERREKRESAVKAIRRRFQWRRVFGAVCKAAQEQRKKTEAAKRITRCVRKVVVEMRRKKKVVATIRRRNLKRRVLAAIPVAARVQRKRYEAVQHFKGCVHKVIVNKRAEEAKNEMANQLYEAMKERFGEDVVCKIIGMLLERFDNKEFARLIVDIEYRNEWFTVANDFLEEHAKEAAAVDAVVEAVKETRTEVQILWDLINRSGVRKAFDLNPKEHPVFEHEVERDFVGPLERASGKLNKLFSYGSPEELKAALVRAVSGQTEEGWRKGVIRDNLVQLVYCLAECLRGVENTRDLVVKACEYCATNNLPMWRSRSEGEENDVYGYRTKTGWSWGRFFGLIEQFVNTLEWAEKREAERRRYAQQTRASAGKGRSNVGADRGQTNGGAARKPVNGDAKKPTNGGAGRGQTNAGVAKQRTYANAAAGVPAPTELKSDDEEFAEYLKECRERGEEPMSREVWNNTVRL
jgi:hypothetical protein